MRNILYLLCFLQLLSCGSRDNKSEKTYLDSLSFLIQNDSTNTTLLNDRAYFYLSNNNLDLAKQDIDNAFSIFKNDVNILMNRGEVYFQLNQTRISKESWERCLQIDPNNLQCRQKLTELLCIVRDQNCSSMIDTLALLNNGVLDLSLIVYLKELKYYDKAINYLNNITHDTLRKDVLSLYAIIYSDTSHYNKHFDTLMSKKYFEKIIKLYPNDMQNYYNYAKFFQDISDYQSALDYYNKAVQIDPNNKYLYYNMGFCYLQMQDYPLAINYFSNSISLDNSFLLAYHARAYLFELSDNEKKAEIDWKNCLLLDPSYLPAIEGLSK